MLFFLVPYFVISQNECFVEEQLDYLFHGDITEANSLLDQKGWFMISNDRNVSLVLDSDTLTYHLAAWRYSLGYSDYYLYLYYYENRSNYLEWITNESCYTSLLNRISNYTHDTAEEIRNNRVRTVYHKPGDIRISMVNSTNYAPYFAVAMYNRTDLDSAVNRKNRDRVLQQEELRFKQEMIENGLLMIRNLEEDEQFEEALSLLDSLPQDISGYIATITEKRTFLRNQIRIKKITALIVEGERLFADRDLNNAKQAFSQILLLDSGNETALMRLDQIKKMQEVISSRSISLYDYQTLNPDSYEYVHHKLTEELQKQTSYYPDGKLKFNFTVYYDVNGANSSFYDISYSTVPDWNSFLKELAFSPALTPAYKENILVKSKSTFDVDLQWDTRLLELRKKNRKIKTVNNIGLVTKRDTINRFLRQNSLPVGRYSFLVKEKILSSKATYSDISLVKYKTVGPEAMLLSMIIPGAGTMAATQGQKGGWAMASFFIAGGGSLAAYFYGKNLRQRAANFYNGNPDNLDQSTAEKYEKNGKSWQIGSYIGFSVTGIIYITDIVNALSKGIQNQKRTKSLRNALKKEPVKVLKEDLIL